MLRNDGHKNPFLARRKFSAQDLASDVLNGWEEHDVPVGQDYLITSFVDDLKRAKQQELLKLSPRSLKKKKKKPRPQSKPKTFRNIESQFVEFFSRRNSNPPSLEKMRPKPTMKTSTQPTSIITPKSITEDKGGERWA
eukprot:TRINITY_DN6767_c0_g1_i1.p4 TRINITY_DN6767_c0_g1~~TRINITY_DN6767_c0_g1_i1.p4  ORF type:complete len:138 (+),score=24.05 TRINITY_DN6767_c0_g1_i1:3-416(+)